MTLNYDITGEEEYSVSQSVKIDGSAGTGKSTQILLRTEKFLKQNESTISDICLVTYRNSLAEDIIDRFRQEELVSDGFRPERSNIGTMHAICNRLIRKQTDVDVSNKVSWYEKKLFCNQVGIQYSGSHNRDRTGGKELFRIFNWLLANKKPPEELPQSMYDDVAEACEKNVDIRRLWGEWKQFKQNPPAGKIKSLDSGDELFDFDELLLLVAEQNLTPEHAEMVIVDEMHDVYPAMNDVIRMWMDEMDDTTFVIAGDKHQVITEYMGATPRFYESIDLPEIKLPKSYRCPESHVEYSHQVLSNYYSPPDIDSESSAGQLIEIRGARMQYQSAHDNWRITQKENSPSQLYDQYVSEDETAMFLVRSNHQAGGIARSLSDEGIPFASDSVEDWHSSGLIDIYNGICRCLEVPAEPSYTFERGIVLDVDKTSYIPTEELTELIEATPSQFVEDTKYDCLRIFDDLDSYAISKLYNVFTDDFFDELHSNPIQMLLGTADKTKLARLAHRHNWNPVDEDEVSVRILTIHASKGMQADNVFLYDGIPYRVSESIQGSDNSGRNECRTWYVGVTRSSQSLVVVRNAFDGYESSPFLPPVNSVSQLNGSGNV